MTDTVLLRIYNGENWNPDLRAPLTQPGVDVKVGDYLLEVNGRDVRPPAEVYSFFEETAGKQTQDQRSDRIRTARMRGK